MNARARAWHKRRIEQIRRELRAKDDGLVSRGGGELMSAEESQWHARMVMGISTIWMPHWRIDPTYNMRRK